MQSGAHMYNKDRDVINKTEALANGKQMAKALKCKDSDDWVQSLRGVDAKELVKLEGRLTYPVVGTEFLPISAQQAFKEKKFNTGLK